MHDLGVIIAALHASEINGGVSWLFDGAWTVKIGDPLNGYVAKDVVAGPAEAAEWFRVNAVRLYPDSEFAARFRG